MTTQTQHPEDVSDGYGICDYCGAYIPEGGNDCGCCPKSDVEYVHAETAYGRTVAVPFSLKVF